MIVLVLTCPLSNLIRELAPSTSAVCGDYTPAGVLFRLARRPAPQPEGRGFVVVGVGEGARGALGHRGDRYPVGGRIHTPAESANWWGGHAAYYGQVGPRLVRMSGSLAVSRLELLSAGALPTRSFVPPE